jgi:hypothetical protein
MRFWIPGLLVISAVPAAQQTQVITVEGQAQVDAPFDISLRPDVASPCGIYFFTSPPPGACARVVLVSAGDAGAQVATKIANTINNWAPCTALGYGATAIGHRVFVSGPAPFDLAVNAFDETGTCAGAPDNLPFDGLWLTNCAVNNLGNGIECDEGAPHTEGLRLSAVVTSVVPTLPTWALGALVAGALGLWRVRRASGEER